MVMPNFNTTILKSGKNGEKTGWTYIDIPNDIILKLKLKSRREFRIKGTIDDVKIERLAVYPVKNAGFIIALNAELRKKLGKKEGAMVSVKFEVDDQALKLSNELVECMKDDKKALTQFSTLTKAQQNYFHNYVNGAKGAETKARRIAQSLEAMHQKIDFGAMIRSHQKPKN